ncbi:shikimate kinase [Salinispira pacifica]
MTELRVEEASPRLPIYLMGMKHSGKSTLGRRLAALWSFEFRDLDEQVIARFVASRPSTSGRAGHPSIRTVFRSLGTDRFMEEEAAAARDLLAEASREGYRCVAALGGGTIENEPAMESFRSRGTLVYLEEEESLLFERIMRGGTPAFLDPSEPRAAFRNLYERRTALYRQNAAISIRLAGLSIEPALELVKQKIEEYLNGG